MDLRPFEAGSPACCRNQRRTELSHSSRHNRLTRLRAVAAPRPMARESADDVCSTRSGGCKPADEFSGPSERGPLLPLGKDFE